MSTPPAGSAPLALGPVTTTAPPRLDIPSEFAAFYAANCRMISSSLRRFGVDELALEDAVQEVFLAAFLHFQSFEGRSTLRSWVHGIAFRVAWRHRRAQRRHVVIPDALVDRDAPSQEEAVACAEALRLVHAVLGELSEEKRAVFVMAELEQLTAPEIARIANLPTDAVYSRLRRARRQFNEALQRRRWSAGAVIESGIAIG